MAIEFGGCKQHAPRAAGWVINPIAWWGVFGDGDCSHEVGDVLGREELPLLALGDQALIQVSQRIGKAFRQGAKFLKDGKDEIGLWVRGKVVKRGAFLLGGFVHLERHKEIVEQLMQRQCIVLCFGIVPE